MRTIATHLLQLLVAAMFLLTGIGKFQMWEGWASRFDDWGYAAWFLVVIAVGETVGGALVLVPWFAAYGASMLGVIMLGAVYTHWSTGIGEPTQGLFPLLFCIGVVALRWRDRWRPQGGVAATD
jgi:uncharacterized membrane protein YphA (DoxX/SURF4 family)